VKNTSYPKQKIKILLLENISNSALKEFEDAGYATIKRLSGALEEDELLKQIKDVHLIGIRSKTRITKRVLEKAEKLLAIGCFCIGTNQVDKKTATELGIAVFNAPYSNTRSVAELTIGLMIMLIRKVPDKNKAAHEGIWLKDAKGCYEMRGKTLGIIGYGNIGSQVSVLAEAFGMKVIFYDIERKLPVGNAQSAGKLSELLKQSDIITLHVPSDKTTRGMINAAAFAQMKKGAIFINYSRGDVVDLDALKKNLDKGHLSGAAVDVFPEEPEKNGDPFKSTLQNTSNVILTPHIGGSTEEAQFNIGIDVAEKMVQYLETGATHGSHSIPEISLPLLENKHRILHIHKNIPGVLGEINTKLSSKNINISGQYLKTNDQIGYVVLDVDSKVSKDALALLKEVKGTIKTRVLF
jgi:D-3-phosphoglycerate dehydrogenase / 2-oxoglutarate reductase